MWSVIIEGECPAPLPLTPSTGLEVAIVLLYGIMLPYIKLALRRHLHLSDRLLDGNKTNENIYNKNFRFFYFLHFILNDIILFNKI